MTSYLALLRGINVGGNNILPMAELRSLAEKAGLQNVRTYIQSGNLLFNSPLAEEAVTLLLGKALHDRMQKPIPVIVRSAEALRKIRAGNPFPQAKLSQIGVLFLSGTISGDPMRDMDIKGPEEVVSSEREVYIHYPNGMGRSKLKLPGVLQEGTMRNMNTVTKLVQMSDPAGT